MTDPVHTPIPYSFCPGTLKLVGPKDRMRVLFNGVELPVVTLENFRPPQQARRVMYDIGHRPYIYVDGRTEPGYVTLTLMLDRVEMTDGADAVPPEQLAFQREGLDL